ncbi:MAG: hypothetical protein C0614_02400, partial [Desulfuromonas sp.]
MTGMQNVQNLCVLTPLQEGILFHQLRDPGHAYFEQASFRFSGPLDPDIFERSWQQIVERHDIFRTIFVHEKVPRPLQVVIHRAIAPFHFQDLTRLAESDRKQVIDQYRKDDLASPFELHRKPPIRFALFRLAGDQHEFVWSFHHILMDGWSLAIIQQDFEATYLALSAGQVPALPPAAQFRCYLSWLESQNPEASLGYWREKLVDYRKTASLARFPEDDSGYACGEFELLINEPLSEQLKRTTRAQGITLGSVLQTLWGLVLAGYGGRQDVVFAATVSGRPAELPDAGRIVGLFINAVPVRVQANPEDSLAQLLKRVHFDAVRSLPHQYCSLAEIQSQTSLGTELIDTLLVVENYPQTLDSRLPIQQSDFSVFEHTNYTVEAQVFLETELRWRIRFNRNRCDANLANQLREGLLHACQVVADNPDLNVGELCRQLARTFAVRPPEQVCLAATFTADELPALCLPRFRDFGLDAEVLCTDYNQVFQELATPQSLLQSCHGTAVVLARFEDALRNQPQEPQVALATWRDLLFSALDNWPGETPLLIGVFPVDTGLAEDLHEELTTHYAELEEKIAALPGIYPLDLRRTAQRYHVKQPFDRMADRAGHLPFTAEFLAAIGSDLVRTCLALRGHPFKVLAVDCDNTLWGGVCGEVPLHQLQMGGGYRALQQFLQNKQREGFLLALLSKNEEADVWSVFEQHPEMLLNREQFVACRIDWRDKPANLMELADEIGLGQDSFIFLDDSASECLRMMHECPEVLSVQLPENPDLFAPFLDQLWGTDKLLITREDSQRSSMYRAERLRQQSLTGEGTEAFLEALGLEVQLTEVATSSVAQVERVSQLSLRTNQFNLNLKRLAPRQVRQFLEQTGSTGLIVEVHDRFGAYGIVGTLLLTHQGESATLDSLLLSCRVLGRGVETSLLAALAEWCQEHQITSLRTRFHQGSRNHQVHSFLEKSGFALISQAANHSDFQISSEKLPVCPEHVTLTWQNQAPTADDRPAAPSHPQQLSEETEIKSGSPLTDPCCGLPWPAPILVPGLLHRGYYAPLRLASGARLLASCATSIHSNHATPYRPPASPGEQVVCQVFAELLGRTEVGVEDNFFKMGGHSLLAIRVISRLYRELGVEVDVATLFARPTARQLAAWIDEHSVSGEYRPIPRAAEAEHFPLSNAQRRLWVLDRMQPGNSAYNVCGADLIEGPLDVVAVDRAFAALVARHEILHTCYLEIAAEPRQKIVAEYDFAVAVEDLRHLQNPEADAERRVQELASAPFDLTCDLPLRISLLRLADQRHLLVFCMHHIAGDGWSLAVLLREFLVLYQKTTGEGGELPSLALQYRDYAVWQNQRLEAGELEKERSYWHEKFAEPVEPLPLATDFLRPRVPGWQGATCETRLSETVSRALGELAERHGASLFMGLQSLLRVLLYRYTMQQEIVLGTVSAGRNHPDLEEQVGFYVNTLALRERTRPEESFSELLKRVKQTTLEAFDHQGYPFDHLVNELPLTRDTARAPLFDVMMVLQNNEAPEFAVEGLTIVPYEVSERTSRFDLTFLFQEEQNGGIAVQVNYDSGLFRPATVEAMLGHLRQLAEQVTSDPQEAVGRVEMMSAEELARVLKVSRGPEQALPAGLTVIDLIREQARSAGERPALVAGEQVWSYAELDQLTEQMAGGLIEGYGVGRGDLVGLYCGRGPQTVLAAVAVLKAGAAYLPIDAGYPRQRQEYLVADASPKLLVACEAQLDDKLATGDCQMVAAEGLAELGSDVRLPQGPQPDDLAYLIYTSGST